ncbi:MAG: hypothetical protein ACPG9N_03220, partial [Miltoncostaeaceae bacterium]
MSDVIVIKVGSSTLVDEAGGLREDILARRVGDMQAASAVGQGALFARYIAEFGRHGAVPGQVLLTSADLERRSSYLNARNTLERLVALGAIPVINENDTTATDELTFGDNDVLAAQVAILLRARMLLRRPVHGLVHVLELLTAVVGAAIAASVGSDAAKVGARG